MNLSKSSEIEIQQMNSSLFDQENIPEMTVRKISQE